MDDVLARYEDLVDDYEAFRAACDRPLPSVVRVNPIKADPDEAVAALEDAAVREAGLAHELAALIEFVGVELREDHAPGAPAEEPRGRVAEPRSELEDGLRVGEPREQAEDGARFRADVREVVLVSERGHPRLHLGVLGTDRADEPGDLVCEYHGGGSTADDLYPPAEAATDRSP